MTNPSPGALKFLPYQPQPLITSLSKHHTRSNLIPVPSPSLSVWVHYCLWYIALHCTSFLHTHLHSKFHPTAAGFTWHKHQPPSSKSIHLHYGWKCGMCTHLYCSHHTLKLLGYQRLITSANLWASTPILSYDTRFWTLGTTDPALCWDIHHPDLWLEYLTVSWMAASVHWPCLHCSTLYHSRCCPFRSSRPSAPTPDNRQVPASCIFLCRLTAWRWSFHHLVRITQEGWLDIIWWQDFLPIWFGSSLILDTHWTTIPSMNL